MSIPVPDCCLAIWLFFSNHDVWILNLSCSHFPDKSAFRDFSVTVETISPRCVTPLLAIAAKKNQLSMNFYDSLNIILIVKCKFYYNFMSRLYYWDYSTSAGCGRVSSNPLSTGCWWFRFPYSWEITTLGDRYVKIDMQKSGKSNRRKL